MPNQSLTIIKERKLDYIVHYKPTSNTVYFEVYPIQEWEDRNGLKGFDYVDKENEPDTLSEFEEDKCLKKFEGSVCWRGVWETRLYFTDEEYWGEELKEMSDLFTNYILKFCKDYIKQESTEYDYD